MHTSDLVAQVTSIAVATVGMALAWVLTRRCTDPGAASGAHAERPK